MGTCSPRPTWATAICAGLCPLVLRLRQLVLTWALPVPHSQRRLLRLARAAAEPLVPRALPGACRPPCRFLAAHPRRRPLAGIPGVPLW